MFDINPNPEKVSLKFSNRTPKDYDISEMQYTFDFIYLVFKRDKSIEDAVNEVCNRYELSYDYLRNYLIENKFIINKTKKNEFFKKLKKFNTKSLKKILKSHGLKTSGKRKKIEKRIFDHNLLGDNYYLSSKSKLFYKNKKRRFRIFNDYLADDYYFIEFNEFYMDNYRKKEAKIPIEFINQHITRAFEDENHRLYIYNNQVMAEYFSKKENYRKMLEYVLKNYCMNLNPIWKIDELEGHVGVLVDTYENLLFLKNKLSKNAIINTYYLVWDSFNFERIIVPKFDGYRYLKDIVNFKDYYKINQDLNNRFYANENLKIKKIIQKTLFDF